MTNEHEGGEKGEEVANAPMFNDSMSIHHSALGAAEGVSCHSRGRTIVSLIIRSTRHSAIGNHRPRSSGTRQAEER
jgi:hypothetical protein